MSMRTLKLVDEFHKALGVPSPSKPEIDCKRAQLRINLLQEELDELQDGVDDGNLVAVLDALTDLQYVLDGAFLAFGLADVKSKAFDEVHRSNMSKMGPDGRPIIRDDGKILKGPFYSPPSLKQFISS
jgi:predicted HAD superfamily Cof-like phosphohydrolase